MKVNSFLGKMDDKNELAKCILVELKIKIENIERQNYQLYNKK